MRTMVLCILVLTVAGLSSGCRLGGCRKTLPEPEISLIDEVSSEITHIIEIRGTEAARVRMREMLADETYRELAGNILVWALALDIADHAVEEAQALYLEYCSVPDMATAGYPIMLQAATDSGLEAQIAWIDMLIALPVPAEVRLEAWRHRVGAYAEEGSFSPMAERIPEILNDQEIARGALNILSSALSSAMAISDFEGARLLLENLKLHAAVNTDLERLALTVEGEFLVRTDQLDEAEAHYRQHAEAMGDRELNRGLLRLLTASVQQNRPGPADRAVTFVYEHGGQFPVARDSVAVWTIDHAVQGETPGVLLAEVHRALDNEASLEKVFYSFSRGLYAVIQQPDPALQKETLALVQRMRRTGDIPERLSGAMATAELDCVFFMNDYKAALAVVEGGVPGFDEDWHAVLGDKIKAHIALDEDRVEDAIALFQKHIDRVAAWEDPVFNPEDGTLVYKETVLGLNEKRIGDLWLKIPGRESESQAAYARARAWYLAALGLLDKDNTAYAAMTAELAEVPLPEPSAGENEPGAAHAP